VVGALGVGRETFGVLPDLLALSAVVYALQGEDITF
jgi:hypothetical protein